jgi:NitT/TauT family transport system permease protein
MPTTSDQPIETRELVTDGHSSAGRSSVISSAVRNPLLGVLGLLLSLGLWHVLTLGHGTGEVPGPILTVDGLAELIAAGVLIDNILASIFRVAWGFSMAAVVGIPLGMLGGWVPALKAFMNPVVQLMRPISPIAWLPIAVLMFGGQSMAADKSAAFLIFLASLFPIITATTSAVAGIETKYIRSARNFGVDGIGLVRRVILPAALPQILTGLRLALGIAWVVVVAAEMLGVQQGLGYQVLDARNALRYDFVTGAMVVIGLIGLGLDWGMSSLEAAALARRGMVRR